MTDRWQILLADDHLLVRDAIAQMLERQDDTLTIRLARDMAEVWDSLAADGPVNLVLLDYHMPGMKGAATIAEVRAQYPALPIGIISGHVSRADVKTLIKAGAVGVFPKTISPASLLMALKLALSGQIFVPWEGDLPPDAEPDSGGRQGQPESGIVPELTERQREVLQYVAHGASNKEIAARLTLSEVTVKIHVASLCRKFAVSNRTQLATAAIRTGAIRTGDDPH